MSGFKPCPFCGSDDIEYRYDDESHSKCWCLCRRCGAQGPLGENSTDAIVDWNSRIVPDTWTRILRDTSADPANYCAARCISYASRDDSMHKQMRDLVERCMRLHDEGEDE